MMIRIGVAHDNSSDRLNSPRKVSKDVKSGFMAMGRRVQFAMDGFRKFNRTISCRSDRNVNVIVDISLT